MEKLNPLGSLFKNHSSVVLFDVTYKDSTKQVILSQALALYKDGIATIINDGQDITFQAEKEKAPASPPAEQEQE